MTNSIDTKKVVYSLQHTTEDISLHCLHLTSEKMSVIFECGKGFGDY